MAKHNISTKLHKTKDKARSPDYFEASKAQLPIVTDTLFFPYISVKEALLSSRLFPFQLSMDRVNDDLSSAVSLCATCCIEIACHTLTLSFRQYLHLIMMEQ
jgi:hypothetical protein